MKIVIISDIHDNLSNLHQCLFWCRDKKIDTLICCGDITNKETLNIIAKNFSGIIYLVRGNIDSWLDSEVEQYKNIKYFKRVGNFNLEGYNIGFCHEPYLIKKVLQSDCQIVFYGHTHKPWIENKEGVQLVNPGALEGGYQKGTFAFWDTKNGTLELKVLENL